MSHGPIAGKTAATTEPETKGCIQVPSNECTELPRATCFAKRLELTSAPFATTTPLLPPLCLHLGCTSLTEGNSSTEGLSQPGMRSKGRRHRGKWAGLGMGGLACRPVTSPSPGPQQSTRPLGSSSHHTARGRQKVLALSKVHASCSRVESTSDRRGREMSVKSSAVQHKPHQACVNVLSAFRLLLLVLNLGPEDAGPESPGPSSPWFTPLRL